MLCQKCNKNEATVHVTQIAGGEMTEKHLCNTCASEFQLGLGELLSGLIGEMPKAVPSCPRCGITFAQVQKAGRLGCPQCYRHFHGAIELLLGKLQASTHHKGRVPGSLRKEDIARKKLQELKEQMNIAVAQEAFEEAARLRDEIKMMEKEAAQHANVADTGRAE